MKRNIWLSLVFSLAIAGPVCAQMIVGGDGNVVIGTDSPTEKLTIAEGNFLQTVGLPTLAGAIYDDENTALNGAMDVFVSGKYAYVVCSSTHWNESNPDIENGVEILDISDPSNPVHVGCIYDGDTTALKEPTSIFVAGKYAYVTARYEGVEILDVSDPSNPTHAGAIFDDSTKALLGASSIHVSGKYAYVASIWDHAVAILDISNPSNPIQVGMISDLDDEHDEWALQNPSTVQVFGKYAYVSSKNGYAILDISDPSAPTHVGSIFDDEPEEEETCLYSATRFQISGRYAYVCSQYDHGVQILDISDPSNPSPEGLIKNDDADIKLQFANDIHVLGDFALVTSREGKLEILDISDPSNPAHAFSIANEEPLVRACATSIHVVGKYAYITMYDKKGLEILDISGLDAPTASIGAIATDTLDVSNHTQVGNTLSVGGALNAGGGGIKSDGPLAAEGPASFGGQVDVGGAAVINDFLKLIPQASPPGNPKNGDMYYDNSEPDHALCVYINGTWQTLAGAGTCD